MRLIQVMSVVFLLFFVAEAQEDLMSECPAGEEEARKCQKRLQSVITPMIMKPLSSSDQIKICCNVAHGIDCLVHEAFPKCDDDEREDLTSAAHKLMWDFPLLKISCAPYEFENREPPEACDGLVEGFAPRRQMHTNTILVVVGVLVILSIGIGVFIFIDKYRMRRRILNQTSTSPEQPFS